MRPRGETAAPPDMHRHAQTAGLGSQSKFERQLHEIESGAAALNLSPEIVHLAVEIGDFEPGLDDRQRIELILLIVATLAATEEGSTRFPVAGPQSVEPMRRLLRPLCGVSFGADGVESIRSGIQRIVTSNTASAVVGTSPDDYKPLIFLSPFIYQHRSLAAEIAISRRLADLINTRPKPLADRDLLLKMTTHSKTDDEKYRLSREQIAAIERVLTTRLTIISGGPGTGKTSLVVSLLKVLMEAGIDPEAIAVAAPTGKAAYRIGESIRTGFTGIGDTSGLDAYPVPATVHRMLGYSPARRRFRYHRGNPLGAEVIIIDEGSMLDLELMSHLLDALRPNARLVILGDADQLPSVSAGAVFRDLVPSPDDAEAALAGHCMRLSRSYRVDVEGVAGKAILNLARAINSGKLFERDDGTTPARRDSAEQLAFEGAEWLEETGLSATFLERWFLEQIGSARDDVDERVFVAGENDFTPSECASLRRVFDRVSKSRMLCLTRVLESGSERLNRAMHRRLAHAREVAPERHRFIAGEPVMMLRNDYDRMLFNGDQGVVLRVQRAGGEAALMAVFARGDNFAAFPLDALREHLELCYAMTVHKAQGSEFDSVAVILSEKDLPILSREILYTAVSRARKSVVVVGARDILEAGISRRIERYSGVREQLAQCLSESPPSVTHAEQLPFRKTRSDQHHHLQSSGAAQLHQSRSDQ